MLSFLQRHADKIIGTLSGFDRLRLRGTIRWLANLRGMGVFLGHAGVLLKDFRDYAVATTAAVRLRSRELAETAGRPLLYLPSSSPSKEDLARRIAAADGVAGGLIAVLECVEPCCTYKVGPNALTKRLELRYGPAKCLHQHFYFLDPRFGFMHARLQTWFPFTLHVCLNGREWLARQLDQSGGAYLRRDNCLAWVADVAAAQALLDEQLRLDWGAALDEIACRIHPLHRQLSPGRPLRYYWSADESEWATDVMFRRAADLAALYPRLIHHGITTLGSGDVLRFLGRPVGPDGRVHQRFAGEVASDVKRRPEGVRIKHRVNGNSVKMYDKQGTVLRVETTINDARDLKVFRAKEGDKEGPKSWQRLRKGVADLRRRAGVSQAANERYLGALAAVEEARPLGGLMEAVCQPVRWQGRRARALNPLSPEEVRWLEAVNRGEFLVNGLRNRDLRALLFGAAVPAEARRQSGKVTRMVRLLRAHGLIQKVARTHRYLVSDKGRLTISAVLSAQRANVAKLADIAA
jgi:hypothetical protein